MIRLFASSPDFSTQFDALVNDRREADSSVAADVAAIIARVRAEGDAAVADLTARFDGHDLPWAIPLDECQAALAALNPELRSALELAADRIRTYHAKQRPADSDMVDDAGVRVGARWRGVDAARG